MEIRVLLGEITDGHCKGTRMYGIGESGRSLGGLLVGAALSGGSSLELNASNVSRFSIGQEKGILGKWIEVESITLDDIKEVQKMTEVGNDVYFKMVLNNGETSVIKTWVKLLRGSGKQEHIEHPASSLTQIFLTKMIG